MDQDLLDQARKRVDQAEQRIRAASRWRTVQGRPFIVRITSDGLEVAPEAGESGSQIRIAREMLVESFARVLSLERAGEKVKVGDFTPSFWHSYAASLYYGWTDLGQAEPGQAKTIPSVRPEPGPSPAPRTGASSIQAVTVTDAVRRAMAALQRHRQVFHNERDFQHALGQVLARYGFEDIRLERRLPFASRAYLDVYGTWFGLQVGLELKYKTRALQWAAGDGETFALANQSAVDIARYDVLADVQRLEFAIGREFIERGFAIFLTNDAGYWQDVRSRSSTADEFFRMHEGQLLTGARRWGDSAGPGTKIGREAEIQLCGNYDCRWSDYATLPGVSNGKFRYLLFEVTTGGTAQPKVQAAEESKSES